MSNQFIWERVALLVKLHVLLLPNNYDILCHLIEFDNRWRQRDRKRMLLWKLWSWMDPFTDDCVTGSWISYSIRVNSNGESMGNWIVGITFDSDYMMRSITKDTFCLLWTFNSIRLPVQLDSLIANQCLLVINIGNSGLLATAACWWNDFLRPIKRPNGTFEFKTAGCQCSWLRFHVTWFQRRAGLVMQPVLPTPTKKKIIKIKVQTFQSITSCSA